MTKTQREEANANLTLLPERCYAVLPGRRLLIELRRGEPGYWPCVIAAMCDGELPPVEEIADVLNAELDVTPAQVESMLVGSMFGWHVPGANVAEMARIMGTRQ